MQIIIFTIGDKYYGLNTEEVEEIIDETQSKKVPNSPDWVEGLINLRGSVVTTINLSKLLRQKEDLCYNNIIIINDNEEKIGLLIKDVVEVIDIDEKDIEQIDMEAEDAIIGILRVNDRLVNIIDINILFSKNEG
ncbi:MAG TPA: chemotaxis protein CheW [Tissierellaceae bacterium]|nr:chemotaxis protein CheW [Tissierellaceae bacterium]